MNSEIKVYSYPNGEIQRVQVVRWDDWSQLDFLRPSFNPASLGCFGDIYSNFLVPARPEIFGQLVMVQVPEAEKLLEATLVLKEGVRLIGGRPRFSTNEAALLWKELEERDSI